MLRDLLFMEAGLLLAGRKRGFPSVPLGGKHDSPASPILSFFIPAPHLISRFALINQ